MQVLSFMLALCRGGDQQARLVQGVVVVGKEGNPMQPLERGRTRPGSVVTYR